MRKSKHFLRLPGLDPLLLQNPWTVWWTTWTVSWTPWTVSRTPWTVTGAYNWSWKFCRWCWKWKTDRDRRRRNWRIKTEGESFLTAGKFPVLMFQGSPPDSNIMFRCFADVIESVSPLKRGDLPSHGAGDDSGILCSSSVVGLIKMRCFCLSQVSSI